MNITHQGRVTSDQLVVGMKDCTMIVIAMINRLIDDSSFRNRASSGEAVLRAEYDEWGNRLIEDNPENLQQFIRLKAKLHDKATGLYYIWQRC